ncbi:hypothetical protein KUTeg_008739 [Tegillarca granosa]|uniref:GRIP domain-containing protein n=1 Tax=Tegillarca granosa TaxID=220873 RepID=A0ABQ9F9X5_TEGGR|nr:hypothetical protein KUTeg_008739 [Tegillarca granosa]
MNLSISALQQEVVTLKQQHQVELWELEERLKKSNKKWIEDKETMHKEEVGALMQEWNMERKSENTLQYASSPSVIEPEELVHQNQLTISAIQSGTPSSLQQQVIELTKQIEDLKEKHRLELAELQGNNEMTHNSLQKPLISTPVLHHNLDPHDPNFMTEAQLSQVSSELAKIKIHERELLQQLESRKKHVHFENQTPPASPGYYTDGTPSGPLLQEPTQMEYLRNILFQYMMGKETKTLARVIATIAHFTTDQTNKVIAREESKASKTMFDHIRITGKITKIIQFQEGKNDLTSSIE